MPERAVKVMIEPARRAAMPDGPTLHEHARGGTVPPAFAQQRARIEALEQALEAERALMREDVREAHRLGVSASALGRWSGYTHRWVGEIVKAAA